MNEAEFTKGPWKACLNVPLATIPGHIIKVDDDIERPIASLWEGGGSKGKPEQIANAHLIAAAPEMYAFLEQLANEFQVVSCSDSARTGEWFDRRISRIKKKLAKARGESEEARR